MLKIVKCNMENCSLYGDPYSCEQTYQLINSYDSTSWTFPRTGGRPSCKNKTMRIDYFWEYIDELMDCINPVFHPEQRKLEGFV